MKAVQRAAKRLVEAGRIERGGRSGEVVVRRLRTEADYRCRADVERRAREWKEARAEAEANAIAYPVDTGYGGIVDVPVEPVLVIIGDVPASRFASRERGRQRGIAGPLRGGLRAICQRGVGS